MSYGFTSGAARHSVDPPHKNLVVTNLEWKLGALSMSNLELLTVYDIPCHSQEVEILAALIQRHALSLRRVELVLRGKWTYRSFLVFVGVVYNALNHFPHFTRELVLCLPPTLVERSPKIPHWISFPDRPSLKEAWVLSSSDNRESAKKILRVLKWQLSSK